MSRWRISFTISGGKLERALAFIHSLSPIEMGVVPVRDGPPRPRAEVAAEVQQDLGNRSPSGRLRRGIIRAAVMERLQHGRLDMDGIRDVVREVGARPNNAHRTVARLLRDGEIRKIGRRLYGRVR